MFSKFSLCIVLILLTLNCFSQSFTQFNTLQYQLFDAGQIIWADLDNDGDYDILADDKIYRNDGNFNFTEMTNTGLQQSSFKGVNDVADYDNDGDLDILVSNSFTSGIQKTKIYINNSNLSFYIDTNQSFPNEKADDIDFADIDNDGDMDILFSYSTLGYSIYKTYKYDGTNYIEFQDLSSILPGYYSSTTETDISFQDMDSDGDLDIVCNRSIESFILVNDGFGNFEKQSDKTLYLGEYVISQKIIFGDFNANKRIDILGISLNDNYSLFRVLTSFKDFMFKSTLKLNISYTSNNREICAGDFNNDGLMDMAIGDYSKIYMGLNYIGLFDSEDYNANTFSSYFNNTTPKFDTLNVNMNQGIGDGTISCADIDGDGDLDIFANPTFQSSYRLIYRNDSAPKNIKPNKPFGGNFSYKEGVISYHFNESIDSNALASNLTYDYHLLHNSTIKHHVNANLNTGFRLIARKGSIQDTTILINWKDFAPGDTLIIRVQAIDAGFAGSELSNPDTLIIPLYCYAGNDTIIDKNQSFQRSAITNNNGVYGGLLTIWSPSTGVSNPYSLSTSFSPTKTTTYTLSVTNPNNSVYVDSFTVYVRDDNFQKVSSINFNDAHTNSNCWVDFDNDGDLDISLLKNDSIKMFVNDGNGGFTTYNAAHALNNAGGKFYWNDFNNDGYIDIGYTGISNSQTAGYIYKSEIIKNDSGFLSGNHITIDTNYIYNRLNFNDFNGDGKNDFLLGNDINLYFNNFPDSSNYFINDTNSFLNTYHLGQADNGDFNNDGFTDIITNAVYGYNNNLFSTKLLENKNNKEISFNTCKNLYMYTHKDGDTKFFDYDSDGDMDIVISSSMPNTPKMMIYKNTDNNFYPISKEQFPKHNINSIDIGDFDNDGDLDLLVSGGYNGNANSVSLIRNEGNDKFIKQNILCFDTIFSSIAVFGDYDDDGDLDILSSGRTSLTNISTSLYENNINTPNTNPNPPSSLDSNLTIKGNQVYFKWQNSSDNETKTAGLTYNIRIGSSPGASDIKSSNSIQSNGKLVKPDFGNAYLNKFFVLNNNVNLNDTFYWAVQTVDNGYKASAFTPEQINVVDLIVDLPENVRINYQSIYTFSPQIQHSGSGSLSYDWQPSTGLSNPNIASPSIVVLDTITYTLKVTAPSGTIAIDSIKIIPVDTPFTKIMSPIPFSNFGGHFDWGDMDNDGDMDIAGMFSDTTFMNYDFHITANQGNFNFNTLNDSIKTYKWGELDWGDYNNDGYLDLLISGRNEPYQRNTFIYVNDGNNNFNRLSGTNFPQLQNSCVKWVDYNNDGLLDVSVGGTDTGNNKTFSIYKNNGNNSFTQVQTNISVPYNGNFDWCDYDKNGYKDLLIISKNSNGNPLIKIYNNNYGNLVYADSNNFNYYSIYSGHLQWVDIDNDGNMDISISGRNPYNKAAIFLNDGSNTFQTSFQIESFTENNAEGNHIWFDYNNDAFPDVFVDNTSDSLSLFENSGQIGYPYYFNKVQSITDINSSSSVHYSSNINYTDIDNDSDFDLIISNSNDYSTKIFRNNYNTQGVKPTVPANLQMLVGQDSTTFYWSPSTDLNTVQSGISYNIYVGTSTQHGDIVNSQSIIPNGKLKTINYGNAGRNLSYKIPNYRFNQGDTIYWGVQAINNSMLSSAFSNEQSIVFCQGASISYDTDSICYGDTLFIGGQQIYSPGNYIVIDTNNCFSKTYLSLYVLNKPDTFSISGNVSPIEGQAFIYQANTNNLNHHWFADSASILSYPSNSSVSVSWNSTGNHKLKSIAESAYGCLSDTVYYNVNVLVNDISEVNNDDFYIYPNPTKGIIYFKLSSNNNLKIKLNLYNNLGQIVFSKYYLPNKINKIDLNNLSAGTYIIKLLRENHVTISKKIVLLK